MDQCACDQRGGKPKQLTAPLSLTSFSSMFWFYFCSFIMSDHSHCFHPTLYQHLGGFFC